MDKALRNTLYNAVVSCRRLLEVDYRQQLEASSAFASMRRRCRSRR